MMMDKLYESVAQRGVVCVGLDTDYSYLPEALQGAYQQEGEAIFAFNRRIIDATLDVASFSDVSNNGLQIARRGTEVTKVAFGVDASVRTVEAAVEAGEFDLYIGEQCVGTIRKEFTFLRPSFTLDFNGWRVEGSFMEWDYAIVDAAGQHVASVSKELFHWTDTYVIDVAEEENALYALMVVLAIDAEKCSRN